MPKFIALISNLEGCDYTPGCGEYTEILEAPNMKAAWKKLFKLSWGDYDPRLGGSEDPRDQVKNCSWMPVLDVKMFQVFREEDSTAFDEWYEGACAAYQRIEDAETTATEVAEFERLKKKLGK